MLDKTWEKLEELCNTLTVEIKDVFQKSSVVTVKNEDGHIEITGPFKSIRINGRLIRLK
jgi:hypothetical protein